MTVQSQVTGADALITGIQQYVKSVGGANMANALGAGAQVIAEATQENILEQDLYDTGELYDSVEWVKVNQYCVDIRVMAPHAAAYEYGYDGGKVVTITDRQRGFFWYKWHETGNDMWKALALSTTYTLAAIPARPYFRPAIDENKKQVALAIQTELARSLTRRLGIPGG